MRTSVALPSPALLPSLATRGARSSSSPWLATPAADMPPGVSITPSASSRKLPPVLISATRPPGLPSALVWASRCASAGNSAALPAWPAPGARAVKPVPSTRSPPAATLMWARWLPMATSAPSSVTLPASAAICRSCARSVVPAGSVWSPARLRSASAAPKLSPAVATAPVAATAPAAATGASAANVAANRARSTGLRLSRLSEAPVPVPAWPRKRPSISRLPSGAASVTLPPGAVPPRSALTSISAAAAPAAAPAPALALAASTRTDPALAVAVSCPPPVCTVSVSKARCAPASRVCEPASKPRSPLRASSVKRPDGRSMTPAWRSVSACSAMRAPRPSVGAGRPLAAAPSPASAGSSASVLPATSRPSAPVAPVRRWAASVSAPSAVMPLVLVLVPLLLPLPLPCSTMSRAALRPVLSAPSMRSRPGPSSRSPRLARMPRRALASAPGPAAAAPLLLTSRTLSACSSALSVAAGVADGMPAGSRRSSGVSKVRLRKLLPPSLAPGATCSAW